MDASPPADSLPALVAAARQAGPAEARTAFAALYAQFVGPVYRYLYSRTGQRADAEDLTAQTFVAALRALPRYREHGHFSAWLFAIAHRQAQGHWRAARRTPFPLEAAAGLAAEGDLLEHAARSEQRVRLTAALQKLNEDERELLRLRYAAGLPFAEMAALLGRRPDAVKKALYRLVNRLQAECEVRDE